MAYVPGFEYDLFLSYARDDGAEWMRALEQSLRQQLDQRLGRIEVWQDTKNIRFGQQWTAQIQSGLEGTAALLAVVSPNYRDSDWCADERNTFLDHCRAANLLKAGTYYRFLKLIKTPWPDNDHEEFFKEFQHINFFELRQTGVDPIADIAEFVPGTEEWRTRIEQATQAIASLLEHMRRSREPAFVGGAGRDAMEARNGLRNELRAQGYDVRPDGNPDDGYSDRLIRRDLERALVSVHILGATYRSFVDRQIGLALEIGRPVVFWVTREALATQDAAQKQLVAKIQASGQEWLDSRSAQDFGRHILEKLKPRAATNGEGGGEGARKRVYLLCDATTAEDAAFARQLQGRIQEQERFQVDVPAPDAPNGLALHEQLLKESHGLLLYRKAAPEWWLQLTAPYVIHAERLGNRKCEAKGFLLNDPALVGASPVPLYQATPEFRLSDIEPFLARLRTGSAHAA